MVKLGTKVEFSVAEVEVLVAISCAAFDTTAEQTSHLNLFSVAETEVMNSYKCYVLFWWCCMVENKKGNKYHERGNDKLIAICQ